MTIKAEKVVLEFTIRPNYASAKTVLDEIEQSLEWLIKDHHAIRIDWVDILEDGEWDED